ncbi:MAG: alpha/beta fold hydrolase, partial [Steroidobacteraceae bacterium]
MRMLPADSCSVAMDLRGHGDSGWDPLHRYAAPSYALDVGCVLDSLGTRDVVLVGHSLGGAVAILTAAAIPHRVRAVVLIEAGPYL